jgi:hypothetical protein
MRLGVLRAIATICCLPLLAITVTAQTTSSAQMWDLVRSPVWDLTVRSVERSFEPLPAADGTLVRPAGQFALFAVDLTNRTDRPLAPRPDDFALWTAGGIPTVNLTGTPAARTHAAAGDRAPFGDIVPPGATVTTILVFDVEPRAGRLTLYFLPAGQPIRIDECKCDLPSPVRSVSRG